LSFFVRHEVIDITFGIYDDAKGTTAGAEHAPSHGSPSDDCSSGLHPATTRAIVTECQQP
jgi:hypothetical protein